MKELRRLFHEAVASSSSCLLINADNDREGVRRFSAEQAAKLPGAYCVETKAHLLPGDFDGDDGLLQAMACSKELQAMGLLPVVLKSGGAGDRAHLWVSVCEDTAEAASKLIARHGGQDRSRQRMRPPFAPHRLGASMELIEPATPAEAIGRLLPLAGRKLPVRTPERVKGQAGGNTGQKRDYSATERQLLENTGGHDRSGHIMRIACYWKGLGLDAETFVNDVLAHPRGAGHKLHYDKSGRPIRRADKLEYLLRTYEKAYASTAPDPAVLAAIERIRQAADAYRWPARDTTKATLMAILECSERLGKPIFSLSVRETSELVGLTSSTAERHIQKLKAAGWLVRTAKATATEAAVYKLSAPRVQDGTLNTPPREIQGCLRVSHFVHWQDAFFGRGSLRHAAVNLLRHSGATIGELVEVMSRSRQACLRQLRILQSLGLAKLEGDRWSWIGTDCELVEAAKANGTNGRLERLRKQNELQRDGWERHRMYAKAFKLQRVISDERPQRQKSASASMRPPARAPAYAYA